MLRSQSLRRRDALLSLAGAAFATVPGRAVGQDAASAYPNRTVSMVVGFPAGTTTDTIARVVVEAFNRQMGRRFIVENRPGATGNLSAGLVGQAKPDGYTLYLGAVGLASSVSANPSAVQVNPVTGLSHVGLVAYTPNVLVTGAESGIRSIGDIRQKSGQKGLTFGSSGVGGGLHLTGEMFRVLTKTELVHVPYRGSAPATTDLISGRLDLQFDNLAGALPMIRDGKLRAIAVTTRERRSEIPDVPTMAEIGVAGLEAGAWFSLMGPPAMPEPLLARLAAVLDTARRDPEVKRVFDSLGLEVLASRNPEEARAFIAEDVARWSRMVAATGFKVE